MSIVPLYEKGKHSEVPVIQTPNPQRSPISSVSTSSSMRLLTLISNLSRLSRLVNLRSKNVQRWLKGSLKLIHYEF